MTRLSRPRAPLGTDPVREFESTEESLNESAAKFSEKYGFKMVPHGERVMYMLMADIEKSIGELPEEDDPTDTLRGAASHG